jgi:hypothetical protein
MIHHFPTDVVTGYATAGAGTLALWLADAAEATIPGAGGLLQAGGTAGLIIGLTYGCVSLWREVRSQRSEISQLNEEIRREWKAQSEKLISVLNKLDKDQ